MTGFQIFFGRPEQPRFGRSSTGVLDLIVDGMNLTARVGESHIPPFLRDLTYATVDLASGRRGHTTIPFYLHDEPWELGLAREKAGVLVTLFRGGPSAEVAIHERFLPGDALLAGLAQALDERLAHQDSELEVADLKCARDLLHIQNSWTSSPPTQPAWHTIAIQEDTLFSLGCDLLLRPPYSEDSPSSVARADLLSLLKKSRLRLRVGNVERELGECFAFLVAERLADLAEQCLSAHEQGRTLQKRLDIDPLIGGIRLGERGSLQLSFQRGQRTPPSLKEGIFSLNVQAFAQAIVDFGRSLTQLLQRHDRAQMQNLRLEAFRISLRRIHHALQPRQPLASQVNHAPESYRAYALAIRSKPNNDDSINLSRSKLRFVPRWEATIPHLDLANTFLCGDRLLATNQRELIALGRNTGEILWSQPVQRAVSIPTPAGFVRIHPDGQLHLHDYGNGEISLSLRVTPRLGGNTSGTVIHAPGLPRLLVVTEGERYISALDLISGEIRWRHTLSRPGTTRLRRAGKLLLEVSGDQLLTAIDVLSGEIVWRFRTNTLCQIAPAFDHDVLFQVTGDGPGRRGTSWLYAIDAWTGAVRFETPLPSSLSIQGSPLLTAETVSLLTYTDQGIGILAFDRNSGAPRYQHSPGLVPPGSSWLAVDDCLFANTDQGELLALEATTGKERFRLQLTKSVDDALPRRLDPVLRSGALFVPQHEVHVVRPRDGELLGQLPSDLIPDLLRVDERCDVYIGEESGLIAAFGTAPRLSLIKR